MTLLYAIVVAAYVGCGLYMALSRHLARVMLGLALLTNGAILLIFVSGRIGSGLPPVIPLGEAALDPSAANALPQALVLTAIVIGFALTAFAMALVLRAARAVGSSDARALVETPDGVPPAPSSAVKSNG